MIRTLPFRAMGCQMLAAIDSDSIQANRQLSSVPVWFETWEQSLSRFRPDSELSVLNRHAGEPMVVSPTLWRVFHAAQDANFRSQGMVTPCVLQALVKAGYDRSFDELPLVVGSNLSAHTPVFDGPIWVDEARHTICLSPGVGLDFGGVAKGWAAQQAAQKLHAYGPALVDAGGDIAISGRQHDGSPWEIGIADPFRPESDLASLMMYSGGVATSGIDYRRWQQGETWRHHIIDPRTGNPAETDLLSVTVVGSSVMEAEMAAKVVLILGSQDGLVWLAAQTGLEGMLIKQDQQRITTTGFENYLWRN